MLQVGGRYACGDPNSLMPVWANTGTPPGPLNYKQIEDVIAFIRAEQGHVYRVLDPGLFEPVVNPSTGQEETFEGWVDPSWTPAPGSTPFPACWKDAVPDAGVGRRARLPGRLGLAGAVRLGARVRRPRRPRPQPSGSPAASGFPDGLRVARGLRQPGRFRLGPVRRAVIDESAKGIAFEVTALTRPGRRAVPDRVRQQGRRRPAQHPDQGRERRRRVQRRHLPGRRDARPTTCPRSRPAATRSCAPSTRT